MRGNTASSSTATSSSSSSILGLEIIKDFLGSAGILFSSLARGSRLLLLPKKHEHSKSNLGCVEEREMHELCAGGADSNPDHRVNLPHEASKPFASFGSYRQRHGDVLIKHKTGMSSEAPARLSSGSGRQVLSATNTNADDVDVDVEQAVVLPAAKKKFHKQRSWKSSWSTEIDHDKEWEMRKDMLAASLNSSSTKQLKVVGRCVSDCTGMRKRSIVHHVRTRSLTDADLDELRGCIDLGFGFKNEADPELWETLPALELCYAISQQLKQVQRPSPTSTLEGEFSDEIEGPFGNSPTGSWQIASPGDRPQQVKTRLRHWARAVGCTVRQSL